jgi:hypothetical protein
MEIQWTDTDPETGVRRFVRATKFARQWRFDVRAKRREDWALAPTVTRTMWEELLDSLERRYQRREVSDAELAVVRKAVEDWREPPTAGP